MESNFSEYDEEQLVPIVGTVWMEWQNGEIQIMLLDQPEFLDQEEAFSAGLITPR